MRIDILTLFPEMFDGPFSQSIVKRARDKGIVSLFIHNFRDYATDKHKTVDDYSYGGGPGMVLKPGPLFDAVEAIRREHGGEEELVSTVLLSPQGRLFCQKTAQELARKEHLVLICGHYEGVDERVREHLVSDELSIGDYVLSGGEIAAMVIVDAVVRVLPGALGSAESAIDESHAAGLLEYPQYTRPPVFRGWSVPDVLLSGNHQEILRWRRRESLRRTWERRPDLIKEARLSQEEVTSLEALGDYRSAQSEIE
ncbi:MAG: tRNA (guanosine(37)-N1)-methyltransferase TrmD [Dehalococcoidia bacterium]|nr:tRNA (guanosine(37)-N1)-methyltransferase TrmD [Dehalococcoidia bacterium]